VVMDAFLNFLGTDGILLSFSKRDILPVTTEERTESVMLLQFSGKDSIWIEFIFVVGMNTLQSDNWSGLILWSNFRNIIKCITHIFDVKSENGSFITGKKGNGTLLILI